MSFADTLRQLEATDKLLEQARELARQGNLAEAEEICHRTLESLVELYGPNSLKTSTCLVDLAEVNYQQRKYREVISLLQQVLAVNESEQFLTEEQVLTLRFKLTRAIEKSGNYQVACDNYRKLLEEAKAYFGSTAPFTKRLASSLTSLLTRQKSTIKNADVLLEEVISLFGNQLEVRSGSKNLRSAFSRGSSIERRFTQASSATNLSSTGEFVRLRRRFGLRVTGAVASVLCIWFLVYGILDSNSDKDKKGHAAATAAFNPATPGALAIYVGEYASADRMIALTIKSQEKGIISTADAVNAPVDVDKVGTELYLKGQKGKRYIFRTSGQALVSDHGTKLFRAGSPELATAARMREVSDQMNDFFRMNGRYPQHQTELNSILSGAPSGDTILHCVGRRGPIMTIEDYSDMSSIQARLFTLSTGTNSPGAIELFVFPVSSCGAESVIVRGYDRDGHLLPCSVQGKCMALTLIQGTIR